MPVIQRDTISLLEILELRGSPLQDAEIWHLMGQACECLQDLFVRESTALSSKPLFTISPDSILLLPTGKVRFDARDRSPVTSTSYNPPEIYSPYADMSELAVEKMYVYSLGMSLFFAMEYRLEIQNTSPDKQLQNLLLSMCEESPEYRINLLDVIELCSRSVPFRCNSTLIQSLVRNSFEDLNINLLVEDTLSATESYCSFTGSLRSNVSFIQEESTPHGKNWQLQSSRIGIQERRNPIYSKNLKSDINYSLDDDDKAYLRSDERSSEMHSQQLLPQMTQKEYKPTLSYTKNENIELQLENFSEIGTIWNLSQDDTVTQNWYEELHKKSNEAIRETSILPDSEMNLSEDERSESRMSKGKFIPDKEEEAIRSLAIYRDNTYRKLSFHEGLQLTSISDYSPKAEKKSPVTTRNVGGANVKPCTSASKTPQKDLGDFQSDFVDASVIYNEEKKQVSSKNNNDFSSTHSNNQEKQRNFGGPEFIRLKDSIIYPANEIQNVAVSSIYHDGLKRIQIILLNGQRLMMDISVNATGRDLFERIIRYLELDEFSYFGLGHIAYGEMQFLDLDKKLIKYSPKGWREGLKSPDSNFTFFFAVKYYVENISTLRSRLSQHFYYLQLRRDILEGILHCSEEPALLLASYALQAETGDYVPSNANNYYILEQYLPAKVLQKTPAMELKRQLSSMHSAHAGLSESQAEVEFLKEAQKLPYYGIHFYRLYRTKKDSTSSLWLGICLRGLILFEERGDAKAAISRHPWHMITQVSFNKKQFTIEPQGTGVTNRLTFNTKHPKRSRYMLQLCTSFHAFQIQIRSKMKALERYESQRDAYNDGVMDSNDRVGSLQSSSSTSKTFIKNRQHHLSESKIDVQDQRSTSSSITDLNLAVSKQKKRVSERTRTISSSISSENEVSQDNSYHDTATIFTVNKQNFATSSEGSLSGNYGTTLATIVLDKRRNQEIGLTLVDADLSFGRGVYVDSLASNGIAKVNSKIKPGDKIVSVNGIAVERSSADFVAQLLNNAEYHVEIQCCTEDVKNHIPSENAPADRPRKMQLMREPVSGSVATNAEAEETTVTKSYASDEPDTNQSSNFQYQLGKKQKNDGFSEIEEHQDDSIDEIFVPEPNMKTRSFSNFTYSPNLIQVKLRKKNDSLGLRIRGGVNTSVRDGGIYVKALDPSSAAAEEGTIKLGDRILAVNGISLIGVTHKVVNSLIGSDTLQNLKFFMFTNAMFFRQARETIIKCPENVTLIIDRSETEYLSSKSDETTSKEIPYQRDMSANVEMPTKNPSLSSSADQNSDSLDSYKHPRAQAYYVSSQEEKNSAKFSENVEQPQNNRKNLISAEKPKTGSVVQECTSSNTSIRVSEHDESGACEDEQLHPDLYIKESEEISHRGGESAPKIPTETHNKADIHSVAEPYHEGLSESKETVNNAKDDVELSVRTETPTEKAKFGQANSDVLDNDYKGSTATVNNGNSENVSKKQFRKIPSLNDAGSKPKSETDAKSIVPTDPLVSSKDELPGKNDKTVEALAAEGNVSALKKQQGSNGDIKAEPQKILAQEPINTNERPQLATTSAEPLSNIRNHVTTTGVTSENRQDEDFEEKSTFRVLLKKGRQGLGFSIADGKDFGMEDYIMINKIFPQQPAALSNKLRERDIILAVNRLSVIGYKRSDAVALLRNQPQTVELLVKRSDGIDRVDSPLDETVSLTENHPSTADKTEEHDSGIRKGSELSRSDVLLPKVNDKSIPEVVVTANQHDNEQDKSKAEFETYELTLSKGKTGLGFSITTTNDGPQVKEIVGDPARADGRLQKGDLLTTVNGRDVSSMTQREIVQFLRSADKTVTIRAKRLNCMVDVPVVSVSDYTTIEALISKNNYGTTGFTLSPINVDDPEIPGAIINQIIHGEPAEIEGTLRPGDRIIQLNNTDVSKMPVNSIRNYIDSTDPELKIVVERRVQSSNSMKEENSPVLSKESSKREIPSEESKIIENISDIDEQSLSSPVNIIEVELEKGATGLGFNLMSGDGKTKFTSGIFIKTIAPFSVAAKDGRLKAGDKLLKVNNESLMDVTHSQAVNIVRKAPKGRVKLTLAKVENESELELPEGLKVTSQSTFFNTNKVQDESDRICEQRPSMAPSSPLPDKLKKMLADWSNKASNSRKNSASAKKPNDDGITKEPITDNVKKPTVNFTKKVEYSGEALTELTSSISKKLNSGAISEEFKDLKGVKPFDTSEVGKHPDNRDKNRIKISESEGTSDYINASLVEAEVDSNIFRKYIASQGPLSDTVEDFWQMIWEQAVVAIGMTTKTAENGRQKCYRYWPESASNPINVKNKFEVHLVKQEERGCYIIREFKMNQLPSKSDGRQIYQLQYIMWPDHGVPVSPSEIMSYLHELRRYANDGMILAHCSAGVGRTGVLIAIDVMESLVKYNNEIDIFSVIYNLREQRQGMVQTKEQYEFCYQAYIEILKALT
ncbi:FERM and PDZ domain-containing protein 2 [Trichoplax sp. H2]|nr:FERM and PDZ domain-containing protein 2 [Trichoplax sp. H2]|eukprot:RDD47414.1 FERM and PDZ domain-containing protein 2 [Trichoplax sp. H2]